MTVTDGSVTEVDPQLPAPRTMPRTVDEPFALVEQGLEVADIVDVGYDEFGLPTAIFIDCDTQITDEESAYEITAFDLLVERRMGLPGRQR